MFPSHDPGGGSGDKNPEGGKDTTPKDPPDKSRIIGLPYTTVSVREPIIDEQKTRFIYNFYTRDERLSKAERGLSVTSNDFTTRKEILEANIDIRGIPMINHIVFNHNPDLYSNVLQKTLGGLVKIGSRKLIDNFKQKATNESGELVLRPDYD